MKQEELLYRLALPLLPGIGLITAHQLIQAAGSASVLFEERKTLKERIPELPDRFFRLSMLRTYCAFAKQSSVLQRKTTLPA